MQKTLLGLDIGTKSIKAVQISHEKDNKVLLAAGYIATPSNALASQNIADEQVLADSINRLVHDMKATTLNVSASLPSTKVITRVIEVPQMTEAELSSSIQWEAEQYIPLPLSRVKLDYAIVEKKEDTGKMKVLLVAAPISIIEKYMRIITYAGLNPQALETEILAAGRSIADNFPALSNIVILSMGATSSEIALLRNHILVYAKSLPIGGSTLTRIIAQELGFEIAQAEEYKKNYGLEEDKLEGKIARILNPYLHNIYSEIEKTTAYFKEQYPREEVNTVVIYGEGAKLPGLVLSITKNLGLDSQTSNPFINLSVDPNILPTLTSDAPMYTVAIGLALKEVD